MGVREQPSGRLARPGADQRAFAGQVSGQRTDGQHAAVRESLLLQARPANGARESLPGLVGRIRCSALPPFLKGGLRGIFSVCVTATTENPPNPPFRKGGSNHFGVDDAANRQCVQAGFNMPLVYGQDSL